MPPVSHRSAVAATIAAIAVFAGFSANPTAADAATTASHFQKRVSVSCTSPCGVKIGKLASNQTLDLDHIACDVDSGGEIIAALIDLFPTTLGFSTPMGLEWQRESGGVNYFTFGADLNMRIPAGRDAQFVFISNAPVYGTCSLTGTRYTSS